jgi:hypothetical protein
MKFVCKKTILIAQKYSFFKLNFLFLMLTLDEKMSIQVAMLKKSSIGKPSSVMEIVTKLDKVGQANSMYNQTAQKYRIF